MSNWWPRKYKKKHGGGVCTAFELFKIFQDLGGWGTFRQSMADSSPTTARWLAIQLQPNRGSFLSMLCIVRVSLEASCRPRAVGGRRWLQGCVAVALCTGGLPLTVRAVHLGDVHFFQDLCSSFLPKNIILHTPAIVWMGRMGPCSPSNKKADYNNLKSPCIASI